ncbi:MAG: S-layer homology domain-containing protein [Bacillota bacterium]
MKVKKDFIRMWVLLLSALVFLFLTGSAALGSGYTVISKSSSKEPVAKGVEVETINIQTTEGLLNIYVMTVDLTSPYVKIDAIAGSTGIITKNQSLSKMAIETGAVGAINGDYYVMKEKAPIGPIIKSGKMLASPAQRTDTYAFGISGDNKPLISVFNFQGAVTAPSGAKHQLFGINKPTYFAYLPDNNSETVAGRLNMYTPQWGLKSRGPVENLTGIVEMVVQNDQVIEIRNDQPAVEIPGNGYVLVGHGDAATFLKENFKEGDVVKTEYSIAPQGDNLFASVGGGQYLLVEEGKRHWFVDHLAQEKKAKSAIGVSKDEKTLYLVVVEGGKTSRGMSDDEFADFLISSGFWTALSLDGGGSSTMVARLPGDSYASLLNTPVYGSERSIPVAIGIYSSAPKGSRLEGLKVSGPKRIIIGTKASYTVKGYDENYHPYSLNKQNIMLKINPELGSLEGHTLTAQKSGNGVINVSYGNISKDYPIRVLGSSDISRIVVTPGEINVKPGESSTISVKVVTHLGEEFILNPGEYQVAVEGNIGTVTGSQFTAGSSPADGRLLFKVDSSTSAVKVSVEDPAVENPEPTAVEKEIIPGSTATMQLGDKLRITASSPANSDTYTVKATELMETDLPTAANTPLFPLYKIDVTAGGKTVNQLQAPLKISVKVPEDLRYGLMAWDKKRNGWRQIPYLTESDDWIVAKVNTFGTIGVMQKPGPAPSFSDITSSWARETIIDLADKGIVNGYPDGKFMPVKGVTRAEFITLLAGALGWNTGTETKLNFKDTIPSWASESIAAAVSRGVVKGYEDGTFKPAREITRDEMAVIIDKALGLPNSTQPSDYKDSGKIPQWAVQSIRDTKVSGIMQGHNNEFRPRSIANRAEATAVIKNILYYYLNSK